MNHSTKSQKEILIALAFSIFIFGYLLFWIIRLYPTLINDEYASLDFIYRSVRTGEIHPPEHRFFKPYSLIVGFLAFAGGPFSLLLLSALFGSGLIFVFYLLARQKLDFWFAFLSAVMLGFAPDFFDNTVQGITMIPGAFFILLAMYFATRIEDEPGKWKAYSIAGFFGGLCRPESWLLAFPLVIWLFPKDRRQIYRWVMAPSIIALSALIWFGKDWFLNHNIFNSFEVARYDREIGTGAPSGLARSASWFYIFLSNKFSIPFLLVCLLGLIIYTKDNLKKFHRDPFLIMLVLFFLFLFLSIRAGLYPQMRFFFLVGALLVFFAGYLLQKIQRFFSARGRAWLAYMIIAFISCWYFLWSAYRLKTSELKALERNSRIQRATIELAEYFRPILASGHYRILMPDREDEQFSWILRDLPVQDIIYFRVVHYHAFYEGRDFLSFEPDWIFWVPGVYQHKGVDEMFKWLSSQDRTELSGHIISLEKVFGEYRVFRVTKIQDANQ